MGKQLRSRKKRKRRDRYNKRKKAEVRKLIAGKRSR